MTAENKTKELQKFMDFLSVRKGTWYFYVLFRRGGLYPLGAYYLDFPNKPSDSVTVWMDWSKRREFEEHIRRLRELGVVDYYHDCMDGDSGDGHHGINPWFKPGNLLMANIAMLSSEGIDLSDDL